MNTNKVVVEVREIGPLEAVDMLGHRYEKQRNIRQANLEKIKIDMLSGRFQLSPDAIAFDEGGSLINGQHRLRAVIDTETTQPFFIARNFPTDAYKIIDKGAIRSNSDMLKYGGHANVKLLSSIAALAIRYTRAKRDRRRVSIVALRPGPACPISACEMDSFVAENPDIHDAATFCAQSKKLAQILPISAAGLLFWAIGDHPKRDQFFEDLAIGANLERNNPAFQAREFFIVKKQRLKVAAAGNVSAALSVGVLIKAWNPYCAGRTLSRMVCESTETLPEILTFDSNRK